MLRPRVRCVERTGCAYGGPCQSGHVVVAMAHQRATTEGRYVGKNRVSCVCELVPDAVYRQDIPRIARIRLQFAPQIFDVRVDGALE